MALTVATIQQKNKGYNGKKNMLKFLIPYVAKYGYAKIM
jgi:hypothetical protein